MWSPVLYLSIHHVGCEFAKRIPVSYQVLSTTNSSSEVREPARYPLCHPSHPRQQPTRLCHQRLPFSFAIESHSTTRGLSRWLPSGSSDARHCNTASLCVVIELGTSSKARAIVNSAQGSLHGARPALEMSARVSCINKIRNGHVTHILESRGDRRPFTLINVLRSNCLEIVRQQEVSYRDEGTTFSLSILD